MMTNEQIANEETERTEANVVKLGVLHFKEANKLVRDALKGSDNLVLDDVFAQRYLGCAMPAGKSLAIYGTPGNDMASYMDGGSIEVFGNAQDQIGNTMNDGKIVIHGRCGDAAGYAMRGGKIFIKDDCGWRVGIHMKEHEDKKPVIVIGGNAGSFLGEYMAGGVIVLLGNPGKYLASGMHGGVIYLKEPIPKEDISEGLLQEPIDSTDIEVLSELLTEYNSYFAAELGASVDESAEGFFKLMPATSRPYAAMYAN